MSFKITKKQWLVVMVISVLFFRFFNLTVNDLSTDDALYSFRALGWFDFLGGGQTTPVQWFGHIPAWANLSFHDAPPLVFAIQKVFFTLFGPTTLAARLPFALAGVGVLVLFYLLFKKYKNENTALWAVFLLTISSYATWISRIGYLEGVEVFFILLSLLFFTRYISGQNKKNLWYFGAAMALAILCKYTAVFLIPAIVLYLLIWQRDTFKKSEFWISMAIFLVVLSPVIIYNTNVYLTRGHFDAALSSMVGMHPADFQSVSGRSLTFNPIQSALTLWDTLYGTTSLPLTILIIISLFYLLVKIIKKQSNYLEKIFGLNILMLLVLFLFLGFGPRFFAIALPLLFFCLVTLIFDVYNYLKNQKELYLKIFFIVLVLVFGWEMMYNINTNILSKPIGNQPLMFSNYRFYDRGFNQLEKYLNQNIFTTLPKLVRPSDLTQLQSDFSNKKVVFFDDTMDWFSYSWYFQKYQFYYSLPLVPLSVYMQSGHKLDELQNDGFAGFYFIFVSADEAVDSVKINLPVRTAVVNFADQLNKVDIKPVDIVSSQGKTTFKVYYVKF
ncbi:glycosyltransferase family 39 protein [Candidatus Falkowbacteria bacterium]|nr:glycosyltransferase family 39 protein [Candidatus Falkowbacteria bacterium]